MIGHTEDEIEINCITIQQLCVTFWQFGQLLRASCRQRCEQF